jgi:type IV pilus assembly protein PilC
MVKAGEAGGVLEIVLTRLAEFSEKAAKIINKVKSAMVYPVVVLVAAIGITAFLLIKVIPQFQGLFKDILGGKQLPAVTQFVIDASEFVQENGLSILLGVIAFILALKFVKKTSYGAYYWDALKLRAPVIGTLLRRTAISRFSRTLGTLLASGVPILQSLTIVRDTAGNKVLSKAIQNIHDAVKEGESMTGPLAESKVFPPMVVSMVEVGEETGALSDMLTRVANTYDDEVDNAVAGLTAAIEPALIIFLASIVGTIVVAMFMPMISIIQGMSGGAGTGM